MTTEKYYVCPKCHKSERVKETLYDALKKTADGSLPECKTCGNHYQLKLEFDHGMGIGKRPCLVKAAYYPGNSAKSQWNDGDSIVQFYPFLVVLNPEDGDYTAIWLPYWHLVKNKKTITEKYGQWAPFIDEKSFKELLAKAEKDGYIHKA